MRFHKTNDISWNFSGITLGFHKISKYFVDFQFRFKYFQKMTAKFQLLLNRFEISNFCTFWWRTLKKSILQLPNFLAKIIEWDQLDISDRTGKTNWRIMLKTVDLLIKVTCFVLKVNHHICNTNSSSSKLKRSDVLSLSLQ